MWLFTAGSQTQMILFVDMQTVAVVNPCVTNSAVSVWVYNKWQHAPWNYDSLTCLTPWLGFLDPKWQEAIHNCLILFPVSSIRVCLLDVQRYHLGWNSQRQAKRHWRVPLVLALKNQSPTSISLEFALFLQLMSFRGC